MAMFSALSTPLLEKMSFICGGTVAHVTNAPFPACFPPANSIGELIGKAVAF